jgi:hypothetical protein
MRRLLLSLVGLVIALVLGGWLVLGRQAQTLGEGLVRDAKVLEARRFELSSGLPGEVLECAGREADLSPDVSRTLPWTLPEVMAVTAGTAQMSQTFRAELESHRPWLSRALACGKLKTVTTAPGLGAFPDVRHGRRQSMPRLMEALTSLGPLAMRDALSRNAPNEALEICSDVLTLTTAWLRLEGLEGMLPTLGASRSVLAACGEALNSASAEDVARFHAKAVELRRLAPDYTEVMALERTQLGLRLFGAWLPAELDAQLPASARLMTKAQRESKFDRGVKATVALRLYWRRFDSGMREVEAASSLAPAPREAAILRAQARLDAPFLRRFFTADPVDLRYQMYAVYLDNLHATLERL